MARLACGASRRAASDRARLASARLSPLLDVEEPTSHQTAGRSSRCPRIDSRDVHGQPPLGRTSHSRRAPEVGNLSDSVDRCQIHAQAATAAIAIGADLPHQSREPDHGRGPVRRAHGHLSAALCPRDPRIRPSTDRPCRGNRSSDCRMDGSTASQCLFRERRTQVFTPRSRSVFADVATTIAGMNTAAVRTAPRSPWQNAYVERVIGRSGASA